MARNFAEIFDHELRRKDVLLMNYVYYENNKSKPHMVTVKLSDDEYNKLTDIANNTLMTMKNDDTQICFDNRSDVLRFVLDNYTGSPNYWWNNDKIYNNEEKYQHEAELIASRKYYAYQLRRIGTNLNQLTKKANEGVYDAELVHELRKTISDVDRKIKKTGVMKHDK